MQIQLKRSGLKDKDPKIDFGSTPKSMQIPWKPNGLEAKGPRNDSGFTPKIMQIHANTVKTKWFGG